MLLDFALDHLPCFVNIDCTGSDACEHLILSPLTRRVLIKWRSGQVTAHDARRRDMLRLIDQRQSIGQWVNAYALA